MIKTQSQCMKIVIHFNKGERFGISNPKQYTDLMDLLKLWPANSSLLTPLTFLERAATAYADCPSVVSHDSTATYTWSQTHKRCLQAASAISSLGIKRGDVVSVVAPNVPAMYELHFSVPMSGAILNNINTRLDPRTLSILLRHSESKLVIVDHTCRSLILQALSLFPPTTPKPTLVLIKDEELDDLHRHHHQNGAAIPSLAGNHFLGDYESLVNSGDAKFNWIRPKSEWDPIALNYTSGTTNNPKGVVLSHRGYFILATGSLIDWSVPNQPLYLWTLPMFHANGWSLTWGMAAVGATNVCIQKVKAHAVYTAIRTHKITHMCGAPIVLNMLANMPGAKPLENPVQILTAGAPPPASVLHRIESLGFSVRHGYGLTETGGLVVNSVWKSKWDKLPAETRAKLKARQGVGSIGMTEMDVVDTKTGKSVKRDGLSLGEVVLRGGSLMLGYLKDPEGTNKSMTKDGWFRTGDVGVIHPDGYLEIKDRLKDVIISGGENISSVEVESVLYSHPAVNEAAVVARPDEFWGETPCAFVTLKEGAEKRPTEKEIVEYCRERMAHFMVPKTVVFKEELPKTSTGKIQKFLLREIAKTMGGASEVSRL